AVAVVLSGTGADGCGGLKEIKSAGGLVIVQEPEDADYGAMPRNAIATGLTDHVCPAAEIGLALMRHEARACPAGRQLAPHPSDPVWLAEVQNLLRARGPKDFRPYKDGTLRWRIERRMSAT